MSEGEAVTKLHSYSSPFLVGHQALQRYEDRPGIFEVGVFVEEKIDGSQFSFSRDGSGLRFRSRNAEVFKDGAGMFQRGVDAIAEIADQLRDGWTYRGEYLMKPKHNTLCYDRVPVRHVILFDIETQPNVFLDPQERAEEAHRLGLESVPVLFCGKLTPVDLKEMLAGGSVLGGKREGLVVKPIGHALWGRDKKVLMAKLVAEDFKEKHETEWRKSNPTKRDIIQEIIETYRTEQRWQKATQHLREAGALKGEPSDIGLLMKEVPNDILGDSAYEIRERLFNHFWKEISRSVTKGLPEWYKARLFKEARG